MRIWNLLMNKNVCFLEMDGLYESERQTAIKEARRLYPDFSPVLAGWVFDYIRTIGQEEFDRRIKEGHYDTKKSSLDTIE